MTGTLTSPTTELTPDALLDAYRTMRTIRDFEERVHEEFASGDIPGFVHLYAGRGGLGHRRAATSTTATRSPPPTAGTATASPRASTSTA